MVSKSASWNANAGVYGIRVNTYMFDTEVHPLRNVAVSDHLVDENSNGAGSDVRNDASSSAQGTSARIPHTHHPNARKQHLSIEERTHGSICGAYPSAGQRWP
jgi:hypothetical protein